MTDTDTLTRAILNEDARIRVLLAGEITTAKHQLDERTGDTTALPLLINALERISRQFDTASATAQLRAKRAAIGLQNTTTRPDPDASEPSREETQ